MSIPDAKRAKSEAASAQKKADKAHFVARFPGLVEELLEDCRALYPDYDSACVDRFKHVLEYNTMGGMWIPPPFPRTQPFRCATLSWLSAVHDMPVNAYACHPPPKPDVPCVEARELGVNTSCGRQCTIRRPI